MCSTTPRFSYTEVKTAVRAVTGCTGMLTSDGWDGWVPGWGMGLGGYGEGYTGCPATLRSGGQIQRSGPRKALQGPGVGGIWLQRPPGHPGLHPTTPAGPAPCGRCRRPGLSNAASGPIRARFHYISSKVSQNLVVSPKNVHKACHSPCSQKRAQDFTS